MKGITIFLADGFEEVEAVAPADILRRAGLPVRFVSIGDELRVRGAHGIVVEADLNLKDALARPDGHPGADDYLIFPGGLPGASNLAACKPLMQLMQAHYDEGGSLAAICAAPGLVLSRLQGIAGAEATCYDGFESSLEAAGARFKPCAAVRSGRIVTGRGPGHALEFGIEILRGIDPAKADAVLAGMKLHTV